MKRIKTDLIYDLLDDATLTKKAREFFEQLLDNPDNIRQTNKCVEDNMLTSRLGDLLADFLEELGKEEVIELLQSVCKAKTETQFKEILKGIQEKLELHSSKSRGEA